MSDEVLDPETEPHRMSRRRMIRGSVAAGATAWVAPMIIDSLASPAAATTLQTGCYRLLYPVSFVDTACIAGTPQPGCCQPTGYQNPSPGTNFATAAPGCITTATGCQNTDQEASFTISAGCNCEFVAGTIYSFGGVCVSGALGNANKTITFTGDSPCTDGDPGFRLLISCGGQTCLGGVTDNCPGCGV